MIRSNKNLHYIHTTTCYIHIYIVISMYISTEINRIFLHEHQQKSDQTFHTASLLLKTKQAVNNKVHLKTTIISLKHNISLKNNKLSHISLLNLSMYDRTRRIMAYSNLSRKHQVLFSYLDLGLLKVSCPLEYPSPPCLKAECLPPLHFLQTNPIKCNKTQQVSVQHNRQIDIHFLLT